jgi:hypothetical protein
MARRRSHSDLKWLKVLPTAADAGYVSTSPRATFSRSVALGLGLVVAILLLGKAVVGLVALPAPIEKMLGGGSDNAIQLTETAVRPAEQSSVKIGQPRAAATSDSVALVPATRSSSRSSDAAKRKQSRRTSSRVRRNGSDVGNAGAVTLPSGDTPAPATGETPVATSPAPSSPRSPVASSARKMKLSVANVSSASGSTASAGGARMRITLADAQTGGAPATATAGVTPAVDLQLGLTARDLAALAGATPPQGPVALRARLDVVDETSAGTAPQMRVRMELAPTDTVVDTPTVVESGDDGGLSNAVEVLIPVDSSQMFRRGNRHRGRNHLDTPTAPLAAEVRLPLATATADQPSPETPAPVSEGAELSLPDSGGTTDGAAALQVAVQLETVTPPAPPSDPTEPTEPAPTPTPEPTPEPTPSPEPTPEPTPAATPEPTPAPAETAAPEATEPAPATTQAAEAAPQPAQPQSTATPQATATTQAAEATAPAAEAAPAE